MHECTDGEHLIKKGLIEILKRRLSLYMNESENILMYIVRILEILSGDELLAVALADAGMASQVDAIQACINEKGYSQMLAWRISQIKPRIALS